MVRVTGKSKSEVAKGYLKAYRRGHSSLKCRLTSENGIYQIETRHATDPEMTLRITEIPIEKVYDYAGGFDGVYAAIYDGPEVVVDWDEDVDDAREPEPPRKKQKHTGDRPSGPEIFSAR